MSDYLLRGIGDIKLHFIRGAKDISPEDRHYYIQILSATEKVLFKLEE